MGSVYGNGVRGGVVEDRTDSTFSYVGEHTSNLWDAIRGNKPWLEAEQLICLIERVTRSFRSLIPLIGPNSRHISYKYFFEILKGNNPLIIANHCYHFRPRSELLPHAKIHLPRDICLNSTVSTTQTALSTCAGRYEVIILHHASFPEYYDIMFIIHKGLQGPFSQICLFAFRAALIKFTYPPEITKSRKHTHTLLSCSFCDRTLSRWLSYLTFPSQESLACLQPYHVWISICDKFPRVNFCIFAELRQENYPGSIQDEIKRLSREGWNHAKINFQLIQFQFVSEFEEKLCTDPSGLHRKTAGNTNNLGWDYCIMSMGVAVIMLNISSASKYLAIEGGKELITTQLTRIYGIMLMELHIH